MRIEVGRNSIIPAEIELVDRLGIVAVGAVIGRGLTIPALRSAGSVSPSAISAMVSPRFIRRSGLIVEIAVIVALRLQPLRSFARARRSASNGWRSPVSLCGA